MGIYSFSLRQVSHIKQYGIKELFRKFKNFFLIILTLPLYVLELPVVIFLRLISPWYLVRSQYLISQRIGHFAAETELYLCEKKSGINVPKQKYLDLFYFDQKICNQQLKKMVKRKLTVWPNVVLKTFERINKFFDFFWSNGTNHQIGRPTKNDRDTKNLLDDTEANLTFTEEEKIRGFEELKKFGLDEKSKFICLAVRDSSYLQNEYPRENWSYHNHRDGNIDNFILACEELASRGYYIFRMGKVVKKPLTSNNPKIIDYANSKLKSDFTDIYLGANCTFCLSTGCGFDSVPFIFRRPVAMSYVPLGNIWTFNKNSLSIVKRFFFKEKNKKLSMSEIFSNNIGFSQDMTEFEKNNIIIEDNTPEEIRDMALEMIDRIEGVWEEQKGDEELQKEFWKKFVHYISFYKKNSWHGKLLSRFGTKFLRNNPDWLN